MTAKPHRLAAVYAKKGKTLSRTIVGESLLIPVRGKLADMRTIFALNPVADFVWARLDGKTPLAAVAREIAEEFEVEETQAGSDLIEFVDTLIEAGMIAESPPR